MNAVFLATSFFMLCFLPAKESLPITNIKRFDSYNSKGVGPDLEHWEHSLKLPFQQNLLQASADESRTMAQMREPSLMTLGQVLSNGQSTQDRPGGEEDTLRYKRFNSNPNSLDLTFHLLREFLGMAKAEKMAQKAESNRLIMESIGK
ncbi:corticoliberin-like [Hypanus sabinus]|uniref:corticoliberin-like n=1 Tax=Hypanus sabinus TaxID=79690 RepID=UPI0028C500DD|nr:corticoliberin-like [Hypanus sabinus]